MNKVVVPVLVSIAILISLSFTGVGITPNEGIVINSQKSPESFVSVLTPTKTTIVPQTKIISYENFEVESQIETLDLKSNKPFFQFLRNADAVSSSQSSVSVLTWTGGLGSNTGFDSSHNWFSAVENGLKIAFIDITANTKTTWLLPNDDKVRNFHVKLDVDSNGDLYFGRTDVFGNDNKFSRLDPSTDIFTEWIDSFGLIGGVFIDSSDNKFFTEVSVGDLNLLDTTTNSLTTWSSLDLVSDVDMDSSGNFYFSSGSGATIGRLNTNTNALTTWPIPNFKGAVTSDSSGDIFFTRTDGVRGLLGRITISDNTLTEWVIPNTSTGTIAEIGVDLAGNVFIEVNGLTRFVPSTEVFTQFGGIPCRIMDIDSSDIIYCASSGTLRKIT